MYIFPDGKEVSDEECVFQIRKWQQFCYLLEKNPHTTSDVKEHFALMVELWEARSENNKARITEVNAKIDKLLGQNVAGGKFDY